MSRTLDTLRAALPDDVPLVSDVTRIGYTALSLYDSHSPNTFICEFPPKNHERDEEFITFYRAEP